MMFLSLLLGCLDSPSSTSSADSGASDTAESGTDSGSSDSGGDSGSGSSGSDCLMLDVDTLDFGTVELDGRAEQSLTLTNGCTAEVSVSDIRVSGSSFSVDALDSVVLTSGASERLDVTFEPAAPGAVEEALTVTGADGSEATATLLGEGAGPVIAASGEEFAFVDVPIGCTAEQPIILSNTGTATLEVQNLDLNSGTYEFDLDLSTDKNGALPWSLEPDASITVAVTYTPTDEYSDTAYLFISSSDPIQPELLVSMEGSSAEAGDCE